MFVGFTLFFLIMHLLGFSRNYNLRVFNGVIHIGLIYMAIKEFHRQEGSNVANYMSGVAMGMYTSAFGVIGFTIFQLLYLIYDTEFMQAIKATMPIGEYLNPVTTSLFIFVECISISLIGSYIVTRITLMNAAKA